MDVLNLIVCAYIGVGVTKNKMLVFKSILYYGHVIFVSSQLDDPSL